MLKASLILALLLSYAYTQPPPGNSSSGPSNQPPQGSPSNGSPQSPMQPPPGLPGIPPIEKQSIFGNFTLASGSNAQVGSNCCWPTQLSVAQGSGTSIEVTYTWPSGNNNCPQAWYGSVTDAVSSFSTQILSNQGTSAIVGYQIDLTSTTYPILLQYLYLNELNSSLTNSSTSGATFNVQPHTNYWIVSGTPSTACSSYYASGFGGTLPTNAVNTSNLSSSLQPNASGTFQLAKGTGNQQGTNCCYPTKLVTSLSKSTLTATYTWPSSNANCLSNWTGTTTATIQQYGSTYESYEGTSAIIGGAIDTTNSTNPIFLMYGYYTAINTTALASGTFVPSVNVNYWQVSGTPSEGCVQMLFDHKIGIRIFIFFVILSCNFMF